MGANIPFMPNIVPGTNPQGKLARQSSTKKLSTKNEEFRTLTAETVKKEDWIEIINKAVEQAKAGNAGARAWLGNYLLGIPRQVPEHELEHNVNIYWNAPRPEGEEPKVHIVEGIVSNDRNYP
jgi:hypothetical protein